MICEEREASLMSRKPFVLLAVAALAASLAAGCSGTKAGGFATTTKGEHTARFVQQPWEDLVVETEIAKQIFDKLGYTTSVQEVSVPLAGQALATGQAYAYLGNWWPSQKPVFGEILDGKKAEVVGTILTGTQYAPAVPGYVVEQLGVRSLADLDKHADAFGRQILGIEPGAPANQIINDAIKKDAYGLGDWKLVESSTDAMLAEVERRSARKQPVAFLGWSPHWMTLEFKLQFLEDPQQVWPGAGEIRVLARAGLAKDDPNLYRFLSQVRVDSETASRWILSLSKEKRAKDAVAREWMSANPDVLRKWLDGVKSADGKPAADLVVSGAKK
jgi:glycine betaine/proline transport system substrate-binding protein